jgi:hypothetical protein
MAVKNTLLGGTNWATKEFFRSQDLNDTFDAAVNKVRTLTAFWLNDELYDVYDDFESYTAGDFTTNSNWTVSLSTTLLGQATASIGTSNSVTGTSNKILTITARGDAGVSTGGSATVVLTSLQIPNNKHVYIPIVKGGFVSTTGSPSNPQEIQIKLGTGSYIDVFMAPGTNERHRGDVPTYFLIIYKGGNLFDIYYGPRKIATNYSSTTSNFQIRIYGNGVNGTNQNLKIGDILLSKGTVN